MKEYSTGQLTKAFKAIPFIQQWESILKLTRPEEWSANAMERATRYLIANLDNFRAQTFLQGYLLPAVRADISKNKKLNVHYYVALKKSIYKPTAFFKGILFPFLTLSPTLKESQIIASIIAKISIPVVYSSVALLKLIQLNTPLAWLFIKVIIAKKYSLPLTVINNLYFFFTSFSNSKTNLYPVIWHQMLLTFTIHYSQSLDELQKETLKLLIKKIKHNQISSQILNAINGEYKEIEKLKTKNYNFKQFDDNQMILE